ncbi:hypothetical protein QTP70_027301 [Hemibagrus guttatus]|uniref:ribonuclease H n=1 Tax=Hemibagrus guttatus TaxID=175788 RepID=A0AAE0QCJ8_9TELE|nr:hypothetical protein QTP70_027301 [Hemibagrus guttatus]
MRKMRGEKRVEGVNSVEQKVDKIRKDEKRMKSGKAVGPDDIPVEVWKCLGEAAVEFLTSLFNRVLESERMPEEWRSVLVPIFKNNGDVQSCSNYRGIKLMSHTMKLWERVVEARLRKVVEICEQQYGFMPRKSTTDAIFALRILMEKYRDGQRELHCVFVDLEKAYDRVPREELWYCMRKSGVAEKYVRVVQDMYERSRTVVRCAVVMDQLSEEVRQESPWTMMFADDIVICSESREQVEENLERWRFALERRGMKVSRSKTEYMCVNEREGSGTVRLQGEEVKKVQEFKYLGSTVQSNGECEKEKTRHIEELKAAVMEYSSVTELLRAEKSKLESQMQLLLPDMAIPGLSLSVAYRLNQTSSGSLETELALAQQNPPEGAELFSSMCLASPLDETLDREVLLLLQGPTPEQMSVEFKLLINKLKQEFEEDTLEVLAALPGFIKNQEVQDTSTDPTLQPLFLSLLERMPSSNAALSRGLRVQLEQRRSDWTHGLEQLKQYTDSLEKELLKMASNMRRSRTEILHLSVRLQEQENHKLLLREELDQLKTQQDHRDAGTQTDPPEVVDDEENSSPEWDRVYPLLDSPSEEESAEFETNTQEDDEKQPDDDADEMEELLEDLSKLQCLQETCCGEDGKQDVITPEYEAGPPEAGPPEGGPPEGSPPEGSPPEGSPKGCPGSPTRIIMDIISGLSAPFWVGTCSITKITGFVVDSAPLPCLFLVQSEFRGVVLIRCTGVVLTVEVQAEGIKPEGDCYCCHYTPLYKNRLEDHAEPQQFSCFSAHSFTEMEEARFPACSGPDDTHEQAACCSASLSHSYPQHAGEISPEFINISYAPEEDPGPEGEQDVSDSMSSAQKLTQDQISAVPTVLERSGLLPVAEEEEPMTEASQQGAAAVNSKVVSGATGTSAVKDNGASVSQTIRSRIKKDLETPSSSMETIGEQRSQEDSDTPDKNGVIPEDGETMREDGLTQSEKDIESEFLRLSLSHRCDMFTLEKRLRLEERSRNLAEENVRKEVSSCQGLLQSGAESPGFVRAGSRGQQSKQGCPDLTLPTHFLQLFWRDPEAFPGQPRDIVSPACPGSSPGSLPGGACPEHLPRETSWRHPKQMPEPPQLSFFDVEEQRLYSELLLGDRAPYPISKRAPCHPTEEAHFGRMYPGSYPFGHDPELMTIGITVVAHMGFEVPQQNYGVPSRSTFQHPSQGLQKGWVLHTAVRPISRNNSETPIPGPKAQGNNPLVYRGKLQHMASELGGYKQAQPSSMPLTMGHSREEEGPTSLKELGSRAQAALIPLCGDDNPSLEIIQRLQKNLDILLQSVTRVASRSEMLGSIHQVGCELEEKERFWSELDEVMESIPTGERVVIGADFNGHVGEGNTGDEEVMGKFGVKERNLEGQMDSIQRKRLAKKKWDMDRTEENRQEYKELQRRVKREVSKAKQKAYDELYTRLDIREGQKHLCRLGRQRDRDGKDVQQVRVIKDRDGRVLTSEESVQRRWKEYFEELMNEENEREKRVEGVNSVEQKVDKIRKDEVRKALKRMKSGKAVGPDDIPVEVWKCLGEAAVEFLTSLFNRVLESERMLEEWRSVLVPIFKNNGDVQSCSNYRGIKLMSHTMKLWERVVEARLRKVVEICEQQYGFMPRKSTTDAIFALRVLMGYRYKYRDGQRKLHCVFVDLEKAYDRVPREELWYCMRKSGVVEKYVRVVQDMYERSRTVVRCVVGQTEEFNVEVGLHQGSALSPFLFAIVMDQLSEEVRQESLWTMMFADDIVICSESREQVEENLERWRFALERRGMKASRSKTEYMCVNEREGSGTVRLQGEKVKKVQEFKYLGSTVQSNGESGKEVKKRVQAGWNGWSKVSGVLCDRKISARIKGKVYRTVVRLAMLYGLETVSLRKRQESELEETRMGKAIEVMIQHVENLRRTYTKEHTELLELRENHLQKERSFISHTDRDELRKRKVSAEFYKVAARRVSIAAIPRSTGASTPTDMTKDAMEMEKLGHQSPSDPSPMPTNIPSPSTEMASPFGMKAAPPELPEVPKGVCTWAALMVVLAAFVAVLGKMLIQPAADAAPVGTGDSWMAIQQILWPYTGLRHNGQPPV